MGLLYLCRDWFEFAVLHFSLVLRYINGFTSHIAQSVQRLVTGWTVRGSNPGGGARFSAPIQTVPGAPLPRIQWVTGLFPGGKAAGA